MTGSLLRTLPRKWLMRFTLLCLVLAGLVLVFNYTYLSIRHDMRLITAKQQNVFEVFYQRARILAPEKLASFIDNSSIKTPIFSENGDATAYVYGYDLDTLARLAVIPILPPANQMLIAYQYALSYPEVINLYAFYNDRRILGMVSDKRMLPSELQPVNTNLNDIEPWTHYFGCAAFAATHVPCSTDEAQVSDIYTDTFTGLQTITMYFPFVFYDTGIEDYRYGLTGIDIAVDEAFKDVFSPIESLNPTRSVLSFNEMEPCRPWHLCLNTRFMETKAGNDLYLKWSYSYGDFMRVVLYGPAFKLYLIALLLLMLTGRGIYGRLRTLAQTDHLTRLPRRDILDEALLREYDYLMLLDIDSFKSINDTHGHGVGDIALAAFARHLTANMRKGDKAIRWGGEEFIVLYKGLNDRASMRQTAARLLASQLQIPELPAPITFSAGVIRIRDYLTVAEATDLADALLYHVKQHGKHNIAYYQGQEIRLIRDPGTNPVT
ncbi:GGDEF domain-containing protein [Aeromonas media]|uniref:GGDEF domain-containing protein n=1 Tax=Aeromonas media TaxID=651 RepID=UPI00111A2B29|nr:GGDEF domain-containing protein [Aeromonas media]TNI75608.1 GGDEF domain-containing protein [Aeromonas media]